MVYDRSHRVMLKSWDALSSNAVWHRIQKCNSAILIQKRVRGMRGRRIARNLRLRKRRVEMTIQAMQKKSAKQLLKQVFLSFQRNVELNYEERENCAITIQRIFRGFRARRRVRVIRECERMLSSLDLTLKAQPRTFVLRLCFLILARLPEQEATERLDSASKIQEWWRALCRRRRLLIALEKRAKKKAIFLRLQANFKLLAKIFFNELKKIIQAKKWRQNRAARKIQHTLRAWLTRRREAIPLHERKNWSVKSGIRGCSESSSHGEMLSLMTSYKQTKQLPESNGCTVPEWQRGRYPKWSQRKPLKLSCWNPCT
uniref:Uncharacterized protein n=1 Tax=Globisporangium ultimum (strain ATCC 200006 / CBS 805.95 / DAOM BR144) TaxID=431595 RepID=K3X3Z8_GLOUD